MIRVPEVRVIDSEGEQLGVMETGKALALADEEGLDLVEVSPTARPPVCRIMDFGKYKYEQSKKQKESKKKQHTIQVKEVKFRPKTEEHDYQFKKRHAEDFLEKGHKVKITMMFRGRELDHRDLGMSMLARLEKDLAHAGVVERPPKFEGRLIVMYLAPAAGKPTTKKQTEEQKQPEAPTETVQPEQKTADEEGKDAEAQDEQSST
jgi:translation initiation factor IF-3